jgi:DNA repair protein RadA/Sms
MVATPPAARPARTRQVCAECGAVAPKWQGRCPTCGEWNSLVEEREVRPATRSQPVAAAVAATLVGDVPAGSLTWLATGIGECDRVLGGGFVPGGLVLLGGDPGIGKSTLALQLAGRCGSEARPALYCAGEESAAQVAMRAGRLGCDGREVAVVAETDLDAVLATVESLRPPLAVVDSVQTLHDAGQPGTPGSIAQVRGAVHRLLLCAKQTGVPILLIGHVTKDGAIAGPRTLEHMVDVVLYLEGERHGDHRLLRGVKNRFGASDELGVFVLDAEGMREEDAPGRAFLDETTLGVPGNVLTVACEGSRPLAVEVQALVAPTRFGLPRHTASGFDLGRLHLLAAVLEKRARILLGQADVFVNAVGGVRLAEPAADLAVALAVAASARELCPPPGSVVIGELGLGGEVRRVRRLEQRLQEARQLGMRTAVVPASQAGCAVPPGMRCIPVVHLGDALALLDEAAGPWPGVARTPVKKVATDPWREP